MIVSYVLTNSILGSRVALIAASCMQRLAIGALLLISTDALIWSPAAAQTPNSGFLGTRWDLPGPKSAVAAPPFGNGKADWSIVAAGVATNIPPDADHPINELTLDFDNLLPPPNVPNIGDNVVRSDALLQVAINIWQVGSLNTFTNLGQVADGGGVIGANAAASNAGDIRAAVLRFLQPPPVESQPDTETLAHAFRPDTMGTGLGPGTIGGDIHFRPHKYGPDGMPNTIDDDPNGVIWVNDANAPFGTVDLLTVMIHEVGHAIGLDHNTDDNMSVMQPNYMGSRRALSNTDMLNVQQLYGAQVPEPV
jgi:Matrixin